MGTTIFQSLRAVDADAGVNGLVEYFIVPGEPSTFGSNNLVTVADGAGFFNIALPHQGQVTVSRSLDYEKTQKYLVTVVASVSLSYSYIFSIFISFYSFIYFFKTKFEKNSEQSRHLFIFVTYCCDWFFSSGLSPWPPFSDPFRE